MSTTSFAQKVENVPNIKPGPEWENVEIKKIADDSLCSTFHIWIKGGVKHHFHTSHTECIYVLEGEGEMDYGDQKFSVKAGDYITIPKGVVHAVVAKTPLHVLSIQTPQWITDDRKFVEPIRRPHHE
jgi:mannose-6-phosphate isomerase-like protein (cupin superfamily)